MNDGKLIFYIDGFRVGEGYVEKNTSSINIQPSNVKYLDAGLHSLEIRFSGTEQFASSRLVTSLLIVKNDIKIEFDCQDTAIIDKLYTIKTLITSNNEIVNEGTVSFYIKDELLGTVEVINGIAELEQTFSLKPNKYVITAVYNGTDVYTYQEKTKDINLIGGATTILINPINAKPDDNVTLKAQIIDTNNMPLLTGTVIFKIYDDNILIYQSNPIPIELGIVTHNYHINENILENLDVNAKKDLKIVVNYTDTENIYQSSTNNTLLSVERGEVLLKYPNMFFGSQHEPLGFYVQATDLKTGEPIQNGSISINIPVLNNLTTPSTPVDQDGGARILHNQLTFTADEFNQLLHFYFYIGKNLPFEQNSPLQYYFDEEYSSMKNMKPFSIIKNIQYVYDPLISYDANGNPIDDRMDDIIQITWETEEISLDQPVTALNGAIYNLKVEQLYNEDTGEFSSYNFNYDTFESNDDRSIKDLNNDMETLNGIVSLIKYSQGLLSYLETNFSPLKSKDINEHNLYRIYDGELQDLNLMDFDLITNEQDNTKHLIYHIYDENSDSIGDEQIFINTKNGCLYARSNIDSLEIRNYPTGTFPINITYHSSPQYKDTTVRGTLNLNQGNINIDMHSQKIKYNETDKEIVCYVSEYDLNYTNESYKVSDGSVAFFIDDKRITTSNIDEEGRAILLSTDLENIHYGPHLLSAEYIGENKAITYTYTNLTIESISSILNAQLNRQIRNEQSKLNVTISIDKKYKIPITGSVNIYLDDTLIHSYNLLGIEDLMGNIAAKYYDQEHLATVSIPFTIDMPADINILQHTLYIEYTGDKHIKPASETILLKEEPLRTTIDTDLVYVAQGNNCQITYNIQTADESFLNDGEIGLYAGENNLITKAYIENNKATINWIVNEPPNGPNEDEYYTYYIKLINSEHYTSIPIEQHIKVIEAQDDVYIVQNEKTEEIPDDYTLPKFTNLQEAQQCVKENGNIHIIDYVKLNNNIIINKNINIIGHNNAKIIKDLNDLLTIDDAAIQKYAFTDFEEKIYEVVGLTREHLNTTDFYVIDTDLFYIDKNKLIPIFLLTDNKFYTYEPILLSSIINNVSLTFNGVTNIENVHFKSNDSNNINDLIIKIYNDTNIQNSVIDETITINNQKYLDISTSAVYGQIIGSDNYNLNDNWWGTNTAPNYKNIKNHIILTIHSYNESPVIGDNFEIYAELIGKDNKYYDLPPLDYYFTADSGVFSLPCGQTVNNKAETTYIDGTKEGYIYCTIDKEKVALYVHDYDYKTEIILDPATDIPLDFQIPFRAKVQSLADTYYKFNDNLEVISSTNTINDGYVVFSLNNKKIGRIKVNNGLAELPMLLSSRMKQIKKLL